MASRWELIMNLPTRECTTIIAFYNGNRSRNVRVIANIVLDLMKYRCGKEYDGQGFTCKCYIWSDCMARYK